MAKQISASDYFIQTEIRNFGEAWQDLNKRVETILAKEEPDYEDLAELGEISGSGIKRCRTRLANSLVLMEKVKSMEAFIDSKSLKDEYAEYQRTNQD